MPAGTVDWTDTCEAIWQTTLEREREEKALRKTEILCRVLDGNWNLQHLPMDYIELTLGPVDNDTGTHTLKVDFDDPVVDWALDEAGRIERGEGQNIHISCDYVGARISGRLNKLSIDQD